ncbi:porin [Rhodobacteraceae bacterium HSP-20]|uniref:Porin n=1 Tax=Paragemmobacter amnigenus TaxID=2852097 RepID=A0ABS6J221_9RHOB|nr:porin [Rhodobacter amnigenus]MBU9697811.1 porin [Rhodobacter amnigenus]MBV4389038.1 porin [Rhodobacter amnigenus]
MLAGTAGFAAAEVALSGYAEIGILSSENATTARLLGVTAGDATFHQDVEVSFALSGETDGGLSFGAGIDLDETNVGLGDDSGTTVFVSGAFGKITMGDTDGALDWAVADAGALTSMGDDHTTHVNYFGAGGLDATFDNQVLRYEYSFGDFGVAVSLEQASNGSSAVGTLDDNVGIGATYSLDMAGTAVKLGLGYQTGTVIVSGDNPNTLDDPLTFAVENREATVRAGADVWGLSASAELANGISGSLGYTDTSVDGVGNDYSNLGLGVTYTTGALSLHVNYGSTDPEVGASDSSYGLAANYDLGGGAVVMAGYGSDVDAFTAGDQAQYSIGLGLSF